MKNPSFIASCFAVSVLALVVPAALHAQSLDDEPQLATQARAILDAYHGSEARSDERKVHVVCWRPQDRPFAKGHRERLPKILEDIQGFYEREIERNGLGKRSFNLAKDAEGLVVIHEAVGESGVEDYGKPDGQKIRKECLPVLAAAGIDGERETIVIFTNLANWDEEAKTFVHNSPYYAGGNYRAGTAWQLDSPELAVENLSLKAPLIHDGEYGKISLGKHNSIFIGGIAHEMGHGFGLPHVKAREDEAAAYGTALMGSGNRSYGDELRGEGKGSFITFSHAMRLASHPQFSGSTKGMNLPVHASFSGLGLVISEDKKSFVINGTVEGGLPIYAVIAYLDPEGGGDYDSRSHVTVPDAEGRFSIHASALVPGKMGDFRMVACLVNGATETWRSHYAVDDAGQLDLSVMEVTLGLQDFLKASAENDREAMQRLREETAPGSMPRLYADALLVAKDPERAMSPVSKIGDDVRRVSLSSIQPTEAKVGWGRPAYDHLPGGGGLIVSGGRLFERGIYAHAEAVHRYGLGAGSWKRLEGLCGLPPGNRGSVVFVIRVDGQEVFRSSLLKPEKVEPYGIDLEGAKSLELITEDGGDGQASDWGIWLDPWLLR